MLESMRNASQHFLGRAVMAVVMGLIIVSFVIWGVGDMLRGFTPTTVASVGGSTITAQEFQNAYRMTLTQYQRRFRANLTNDQARAFGVDRQVLQGLLDEAAMGEKAKSLGLAISDESLVDGVRANPAFQDASGQFSKIQFEQALREAEETERGFFASQRKSVLAGFIESAFAAGLTAPRAMVAADADYEAQTRAIDYLVLAPSAAGDLPAPTTEALKSFFEARKADYRAPEYRGLTALAIDPEVLAKPGEVSDEDAKAAYEKDKETRFGSPEKRKLQQIVFPSEAEAAEAAGKLRSGASFDDLVKARGLAAGDIDLGETTKAAMFDKAVAESAFALPEGGVSDVLKGQFGPVILRAVSITPASIKPYDAVAAEIKKAIAVDRAAAQVQGVHDRIEDERVSGKSLADAANAVGQSATVVAAVDAKGLDPKGAPVALPESAMLLKAAFASDVGVDEAPLQTRSRGFVWFEISKVDPARERSFEEARDAVERDWRAGETDKALAAKADDLVNKGRAGASIASLAEGAGVAAKSVAEVRRAGSPDLAEGVVAAVFALPEGAVGSAASPNGRVIFKIVADKIPPVDFADARVTKLADTAAAALRDDILGQYVGALKRELGVAVHEAVLQAAVGN